MATRKEKDNHIYRRGRYYHGRVKKDGWWQTRSLGTDDIKIARAKYAKLVVQSLKEGPLDEKPAKPFEPLLDVLKAHIRATAADKDKKATAAQRQRNCLAHLERLLGNPRLNTLTREQLEAYIQTRLGEGAEGGTVRKEVAFLKAALTRAVDVGKRVPPTLARGVKAPKDRKRNRLLTKQEIARLREELGKATILDHFVVSLYMGFRKGELRQIRMEDVDFQAGTITIPETKNGDGKTVTMHRVVKEIMFRRRSDDPSHQPFHSPANLIRPFKRAARRARVQNVRWHDLRRAMASHMLMNGTDIATVQKQGGWKRPTTLLEVYAQVTSEHVKAQVERLDFEGGNGAGTDTTHPEALEPCDAEISGL